MDIRWSSLASALWDKVIHLDKHIAGRRLVTASCMLRETTRRVVRGCIVRARSLYNSIYFIKRKAVL